MITGILVGVIIVLFLRHVVGFRAISIVGDSMEPTYHNGQILIIQELKEEPHHGDLVLFDAPESWRLQNIEEAIIKRVIAFEGDTVRYNNGYVSINNIEHYSVGGSCSASNGIKQVPEGFVVVRGDNAGVSLDSIQLMCDESFELALVPVENIESYGKEIVKFL